MMHTCRRSSAAGAVALMLLGTLIFGVSPSRASDDLSLGLTALNSGSAELAVKHFSAVIQSGKRSVHELSAALHYRARAYTLIKKPALAIADIDSALWLGKMSPIERESALRLKNKALQSVGLAAKTQDQDVSKPLAKSAVATPRKKAEQPVAKAETPKPSSTRATLAATKQPERLSKAPSVTPAAKVPKKAVARVVAAPSPNWVTRSVKVAAPNRSARAVPPSADAVVKKPASVAHAVDAAEPTRAAGIVVKPRAKPARWPQAAVKKPVKSEPLKDAVSRKPSADSAVVHREDTTKSAPAAVAARPAVLNAGGQRATTAAKPTQAVAAVAEPWKTQLDRDTVGTSARLQSHSKQSGQPRVRREVQTGSIAANPQQVVEQARVEDEGDEPAAAVPGLSVVDGFMSLSGMTTKAPPETADRLRAADELARRRREMIRRHNALHGAGKHEN